MISWCFIIFNFSGLYDHQTSRVFWRKFSSTKSPSKFSDILQLMSNLDCISCLICNNVITFLMHLTRVFIYCFINICLIGNVTVTTEFRIFTIYVFNTTFVTSIVTSKIIARTFNILAITVIIFFIRIVCFDINITFFFITTTKSLSRF